MKKFNFFISAILSVMFILGVMSCNNLIPINPNKNNETESGFGEISAKVFVPDYSKMAGESRIVAPQSATINLRYKTDWNNEWQDLGSLDIDMSALESVDDSYDLPGGIWKGVFEDIPSGTYGPGKFKVRLLDDTGNVITTGINSVEVVIKAEEITENVVFYQTPVNSSNNTGTLAEGKMLFWMFTMEKGYDYTLTVNAEGTYPDIVLFDSDGTYKEYHSIDSAEKAKVPVSKVTEKTVYYVGVYADDGDVTSYSISFGYTDENGNVVSGGLEAAPYDFNISFDLSGAEALATMVKEEANRSARAADDAKDLGVLAKILEDGSMKSVITTDIELSQIKYIMQSPSARNNQLYIVFENEVYAEDYYEYTFINEDGKVLGTNRDGSWIDGAVDYRYEWKSGGRILGSLVCVYEDGSYVDVLSNSDGINRSLQELEQPLVFDDNGYMYYLAWEHKDNDWANATTIIYRYNPNTRTSEQKSVGVPGYTYSKIQVSKDGQWIFARGRSEKANSEFIKAISVANPSFNPNLLYSSSGWLNVGDWFYDNETDAVYVASTMQGKWGLLKFVKDTSNNFSNTSYNLFTNTTSSVDETKQLYNNMQYSYIYNWNTDYLDSDGVVNGTKVIQRIVDAVNESMPKKSWYYYNFYKREYIGDEEIKTLVDKKVKLDHWPYDDWGNHAYTDVDWDDFEIYYWNADYTRSKCLPGPNETFMYSDRYEADNDYKMITLDDIDIRFDNPDFAEIEYEGLDYEKFVSDMNGLKNEAAIRAINGKLQMLRGIHLVDVLYLKGTDTRLCDDTESKYFVSESESVESYNNYDWILTSLVESSYSPRWNEKYYDRYGNLDYKEILKYFYSFSSAEGDCEFRLDRFKRSDNAGLLYTTKTDEDALEFICENEERLNWFYNNYMYDIARFVTKTCFFKNTDESIIPVLDMSDAYFPYWSNVYMLEKINGQLWGVEQYEWNPRKDKIICLLDESGKYAGLVSTELKDLCIQNVSRCDKGFYFKNQILSADGSESGSQDVRVYDIWNDTVTNLFQKFAGKDSLTIESITMAGNNLYICALNGMYVANYRINMDTLDSEILAVQQKFKDIISFSIPTDVAETKGYAITTQNVDHAKFDDLPKRAETGDTITFKVSADNGYSINSVTVDGTPLEKADDGTYSFEMPSYSVQISAIVYEKVYLITAEAVENAVIELVTATASPGDTINFRITAAEGYFIQSVKAGNEQLASSTGMYSFTMPKDDVEISVEVVEDAVDLGIVIY